MQCHTIATNHVRVWGRWGEWHTGVRSNHFCVMGPTGHDWWASGCGEHNGLETRAVLRWAQPETLKFRLLDGMLASQDISLVTGTTDHDWSVLKCVQSNGLATGAVLKRSTPGTPECRYQ